MDSNAILEAEPVYSLALRPAPIASLLARRLAIAVFESWGLPHLTDDGALIVAELITNAAAHAEELGLSLFAEAGEAVIEVWDSSPEPPAPRGDDLTALGGRGLLIVQMLSTSWGWHPVSDGKVIWSRLALKPESG